jgi:transposase
LTAILKDHVGVSYGDIHDVLQKGFGIELSRGGAAKIVLRVGEKVRAAYRGIQVVIHRSRVVYPDETGWKVAGWLQWLWTFVSKTATLFVIRPSRGRDVPQEVLGAGYSGTMGHDGWAPYDSFEQADHQQCLGHILRRCELLIETATRATARFPRAVVDVLHRAFRLRDRRDTGEISRHGLRIATGQLEWELHDLLMGRFRNPANERLARHLGVHLDQIFTFLWRPGIEATSWMADQAIRRFVANRKVFGGNRTEAGARAQERIGSVAATCLKRGLDLMKYLIRVVCARPERRDLVACRLLGVPAPP